MRPVKSALLARCVLAGIVAASLAASTSGCRSIWFANDYRPPATEWLLGHVENDGENAAWRCGAGTTPRRISGWGSGATLVVGSGKGRFGKRLDEADEARAALVESAASVLRREHDEVVACYTFQWSGAGEEPVDFVLGRDENGHGFVAAREGTCWSRYSTDYLETKTPSPILEVVGLPFTVIIDAGIFVLGFGASFLFPL